MTPDSQHPADYLIDRTLNALREAQPRAGAEAMNRRLLATLQSRELATAQPTAANVPVWQRLRRLPIAAFALPAAATLLIAVVVLLPRTRTVSTAAASPTQNSNLAKAVMDQTALQPATQPRQGVPNTGVPSERISSLGWHFSLLRCGPATSSNCATTRLNIVPAETTSTPNLTEQAMLDDLRAPSQPAPHMPLTREERLLVRAARQDTEVQLAHLEALPRPSARDNAIAQYIHRMLAPLAMAEALDPTPQPEPDGAPATTTVPDQTPLSPR